MRLPMLRRPIDLLRRFRFLELKLLITALAFFAAGYLLVVFATRQREVVSTVPAALSILWPSSLPILLFAAISIGLNWRAPRTDQMVLPLVAMLAGLGLMLTARLEPSLTTIYGDTYAGVASKQSLWVTIGIGILALMLFLPLDNFFVRFQQLSFFDWLDHHRYVWLSAGLLLMLATFLFGVDPNGSGVRVWFNLGLFYFQPAELLKIVLVVFLASYLAEHREVVSGSYQLGPLKLPPLPYLIPLAGMWGLTMAIIVFQRDLGAALLLFGVFLAMLYVATNNGAYVLAGSGAFAVGAYALYHVVKVVALRVAVWLDPWAVAQDQGYQLVQATYALASGGLFGSGLGKGVPAVIPAVHTDFAFAAIGEEMGLAGTLGVLLIYILLIARGFHIALSLRGKFRDFEQFLAIGLTSILAIQTLVIIGGNLRLIPLTGVTLPFISYGGSSVIINFLIIGLLLRLSGESGK